jgi:hypothetical protein
MNNDNDDTPLPVPNCPGCGAPCIRSIKHLLFGDVEVWVCSENKTSSCLD